jgi:Ca-activated chloride channel family protein
MDRNTGTALPLAIERLWLTGQVLPAGARLIVQHVFRSAGTKPIEVVYSFPLPRDAAMRRFRISGDGFETNSELRATEDAVKDYEEGLAQGSLAALARQHGDGVVNLTVGNIRPGEQVTVHLELLAGVELRDDGFRFRFPFTIAPTYHAHARAAVVDGAGEMELPSDEFGDVILPRFDEDASALHQVGFDLSIASALEIDELGSPSHAIRVRRESSAASRVALSPEKDVPNRDLVLDAHYRETRPQVMAGPAKDGNGHFAAIVPSTSFGAGSQSPRRVVILLDRSGSMSGAPLTQAAKAIGACLATLSEADSFGLVAFDDAVETCDSRLLAGTRENRDRAHAFLASITARGGTELACGFQKAVEILEGRGGDVLIFTDGQVAGTEQILASARQANTRLHCLGIGSASQDRFLALLARETGGISRFVTPRERVDLTAVDLFASMSRPVASGLKSQSQLDPAPPSSVFAGTPAMLFGEAADGSEIDLAWDGGSLTIPVYFASGEIGEAVRLLAGARLITDWESRYPSAEALPPVAKRTHSRVAARLRELSQTYGLASREMSLVAVVKRAGDRPGQLPETRLVSVGMPEDTRFDAYFPISPSIAPRGAPLALLRRMMACAPSPARPQFEASRAMPDEGAMFSCDLVASPAPSKPSQRRSRFARFAAAPPAQPVMASEPDQSPEDALMSLAAALDSDGGLPGESPDARVLATLAALLAFVAHGHTPSTGAFRSHVARMVEFLASLRGLNAQNQHLLDRAIAAARAGHAPAGNWIELAQSGAGSWEGIEQSFAA